ncbi:MAG: DUF1569 domain-containing protein [Kurthia sp.]
MKTIFEKDSFSEVFERLDRLTPQSQAQWGSMNVAQMLAHCNAFQDIPMQKVQCERDFIGRFVGPFIRPMMYNDKPLPHDLSTISSIKMTDEKNFDVEKITLKSKLQEFYEAGPDSCEGVIHPFFGKLKGEQWGKGVYKHLDHHFQQFGV